MLAGPADVKGLLKVSLELALTHLPSAEIALVTPNATAGRRVVESLGEEAVDRVGVWSDEQLCPEAQHVPGWFRQQYLKLHVDRLAEGPLVAVIGADTLVLDPVSIDDLLDSSGGPVLRYFRYDRPNQHLAFERRRVRNVSRMLGVEPKRSLLLGDFVCDLFVFDVVLLRMLREHLGGQSGLLGTLEGLGARQGADDRFGEWTAYAVYCLELASIPMTARRAENDYFGQVHSGWELCRPDRYRHRIVHFAWKPPDPAAIREDLIRCGRLRMAAM